MVEPKVSGLNVEWFGVCAVSSEGVVRPCRHWQRRRGQPGRDGDRQRLLEPGNRPTLAAIAAEAGVSLPTVSKVVNGRPTWRPTPALGWSGCLTSSSTPRRRAGAAPRSGLIDLIFNGLDSPWAVEILRGVEDWCSEHAMARRGLGRPARQRQPASWTSALASHDTDGVILVTSELTMPQLQQVRERRHPARGHRPGQPAASPTSRASARRTGPAASPLPITCSASATAGSARSPARPTTCAAGPG